MISCAAYLALWLAVPHIPAPRQPKLLLALMVLITAAFMLAQLSISRWFASLTVRPVRALLLVMCAGIVWLILVLAVTAPYSRYEVKGFGSVPRKFRNPPPTITVSLRVPVGPINRDTGAGPTKLIKVTGVRRPADLNFRLFTFDLAAGRMRALTSLLMIIAASAFGYLVSFILRTPSIVLPVAAFAPFIDIWTVFLGPTGRALEKTPHIVRAVSAALPSPGGAAAGFQPASFVGPADIIFLALFFGALYRLRMEPARTFWLMFPVLTLGMAAVMAGRALPGLPALVLVGAVIIIANWRHFKLKRDEWIAMGIVAALLIGAGVALSLAFVSRK